MLGRLLIFISFSVTTFTAFATATNMSAEQRQALSALPGGKLDLATLLSIAKQRSDTYKGIQAVQLGAEAAELRARSPYRPLLSAQISQTNSELEPASPFEPNRLETSTLGLGVKQNFLSGTSLGLDARFGPTELGFRPGANSPGTIDFNESRFDIVLGQSLWRDSFGASSRLGYKAEFLSAEIFREQRRAELEVFALSLADEFYEAWLAQARVLDAAETLKRRQRIQKMTRVRAARGTAERPDVLESEAASVSAELEVRESSERLQESWLKLAVALKLDAEIAAKIDPSQLPLVLDPIDPTIGALCQNAANDKGSAALSQALVAQKRAEIELERAEIDKRPDLNLRARYSTNGIDSALGASAREAARSDHVGWEVGLRFEMPLGLFDAEAKRRDSQSTATRTGAQARALADQERVRWGIRCKEIARRLKDLKYLDENSRRQTERSKLEEERFAIGRIRLNDVTRAEDESLIARIRLRQEEVSLRRTQWSLRELSGQIPEALEALP